MRRGPLAAATRGTVVLLALAAAVRGIGTVLIAEGVARGVAAAATHGDWRYAAVVGTIGVGLRAAAAWAGTTTGALAGAGLTADLRSRLGARALGPGAPADAVLLGAHRLDDLQTYCTRVLPALVNAAVVPVVVGLRILLDDWVSAVVIACTLPLVPLFMVLIGLRTRDRVQAAAAALERLTAHLLELAKGLPVLVGLGRIDEQAAVLHRISVEHRRRTMGTLRVVFLSSLALELVSTLSVAVIAVSVGIRLLSGDLPLWTGLLALVLAPECYSVLRDVGAAFHAGDDGLAAFERTREILDQPVAAVPTADGPAAISGLIVHFTGRGTVVPGLDLVPQPDGITALVGRSGSGKSTVLRAFAGLLDGIGVTVTGTVTVPAGGVALLPQHPAVTERTVVDELRLYGEGVDDARLLAVLEQVGLAPVAEDDPRRLSPGELQRLAMARVLVRVDAGARLVLLDEPTAHLDEWNRRLLDGIIDGLRGRTTVVLASHEASTTGLADRLVHLGDGRAPAVTEPSASSSPAVEPPRSVPVPSVPDGEGGLGGLGGLFGVLRPNGARFVLGALLGIGAAAAGAALTAVSGWLIVRASEQPSITFLLVAIVGVRFFGLARAGLRYAERLLMHSAVLRTVTALRDRLWLGLAAHGAASRRLASGATALDLLVVGVDQVRDLIPRVLIPPVVGGVVATGAIVTTAVLAPGTLPVAVVGLLVAFVVAPLAALLAERGAGSGVVLTRGAVAQRFASAVAASDDLRSNGVASRVLAEIRALDGDLLRLDRRRALAQGIGGALAVLGCSGTAIGMIAVGVPAGVDAPVLGVLVLLPLALLEAAQATVDGVRGGPALVTAWGRLRPVLRAPRPTGTGGLDAPVDGFSLVGVAARWSERSPLVFAGVDATVGRGRWLVVDGPSGVGKSTLLSVLLGALPAATGRYRLGGTDAAVLSAAAISAQVAWLPQDAHVFDSTVRANLRLGARDATDTQLWAVLDRVGLGQLVCSADGGLDLRVGASGNALSGGERTRLALARTLLSDAAVVLLDEPTAHLDAETAAAVMADLRRTLVDRTVVLVSHRPEDRRPDDRVLVLGDLRVPPAARTRRPFPGAGPGPSPLPLVVGTVQPGNPSERTT